MAPLGAAAVAAIEAELATKHGRHSLAQTTRDKLRDFWAERGEVWSSLPIDVDSDNVEVSREEWRDLAESAGIDVKYDVTKLLIWLEERATGPRSGRSTEGAVRGFLDVAGMRFAGDSSTAVSHPPHPFA